MADITTPSELAFVRIDRQSKPIRIWEIEGFDFARLLEGIENSIDERRRAGLDKPAPSALPYATIEKDGEVIATIFNSGTIDAPDLQADFDPSTLTSPSATGVPGPEYAQARAEALAHELGATITIAATALNQTQYDALPPNERRQNQPLPESDFQHETIERMRELDQLYDDLQAGKIDQATYDFALETHIAVAKAHRQRFF